MILSDKDNKNDNTYDCISIDKGNKEDPDSIPLNDLKYNLNVMHSFDKKPEPKVIYVANPKESTQSSNTSSSTASIVLFVVGFFIPLCWLFNACCYARSKNSTSRTLGIISAVFFIIIIITIIIIVSTQPS